MRRTSVEPPEARTDVDAGALAGDVLRYWLAAVRLEETLKVRPRARRLKHGSSVPRLDFPSAGQEYFKLPLAAELGALLSDQTTLRRDFDGELAAFFESWLLAAYRRGTDESELAHLLCFPVVHLPRGELAGLLRCVVRLQFGSDDQPFRPPSRRQRQGGEYPPPPQEVRIVAAPRSEQSWPFFIDTRLLSHPLGLDSEEIDQLFEALRGREEWTEREMLALVTDTLERAARADAGKPTPAREAALAAKPAREVDERDTDAHALLLRLKRAMQTLLARTATRAEVYPVGIVIDGAQAKTTWHLQRELAGLLEAQDKPKAFLGRCLAAYLTRAPLGAGEVAQRALFSGPALTARQRSAAEHFWGSPLTAVQGPPGTGKTTLILHLCAEALARQVDSLLDKRVMGADLLVITSGNNRAVDNVIDPLCAGEGLPLALRVGSRQVCEHTLSAQLRRTLSWLKGAQREPAAVHVPALAQASERFERVRAELDTLLAPRRLALAGELERSHLTAAIAALSSLGREPPDDAARPIVPLTEQAARAIEAPLAKLERRLEALVMLCGKKPGMAEVNAVARHYERTAKRDLPPLEQAVAAAHLTLEVPLPPLQTPLDPEALMEAWEDGAVEFLERLLELRELVLRAVAAGARERKTHELSAELAALGPPREAPLPESGGHDELSRALFAAALSVREAWAKVHAAQLEEAVELALQAAEQERSLRPLFRNDPEQATLLCRLFGVWGSTLLSLGNCLPADIGSVARLVIDEAGQCHPAHAVCALLRARSAMVIGDVHQLPPVIELTADDEARLVRASRLKTPKEQLAPFRVSGDSQVSAQSLADRAVQTRHVLTDHYRCQPEIIAISDALCGYGLTVHTPRHGDTGAPAMLPHAVSMLDLRGAQERVAGSLYNELEREQTLALVERLLARGAAPSQIAIITPYRGQLEQLRRGLAERRIPLEFSAELGDGEGATPRSAGGLALGTVHRFQGGERSIVLFSSVVTRPSSLPFLNARPNLLNVAVSRAQRHLVCIGDRSVLLQGKLTRILVEAAHPMSG
jgi:hypothetical protein